MIIVNSTVKTNCKGKSFLNSTVLEPHKGEVVNGIANTGVRCLLDGECELLVYVKSIDIVMPDLENLDDQDYIEMAKGAATRYKEFFPKEANSDRVSLFKQVKNKAQTIFKKEKVG